MIYLDKFDKNLIYYKDSQNFGFGYSFENLSDEEYIITQDKTIYNKIKQKGYQIYLLSDILKLPDNFTLFEIFSLYFSGKVSDDFDMLKAIFNGLLTDSERICYCLKLSATFCWFYHTEDGLKKLGTLQFSFKDTKYNVGNFIKQLNYHIAMSGVSLNNVKYLVWDDSDVSAEFYQYIYDYKTLIKEFQKVEKINTLTCLEVYKYLSSEILLNPVLTAERFIDVINANFKQLSVDDNFNISDVYLKDYSRLTLNNKDYNNLFIILDCEGKKNSDGSLTNGVSQIGGIICYRYNKYIVNIDTFYCDNVMLNETINIVFKKYKSLNKKEKFINIIVYGTSDEQMFLSSFEDSKHYKLNFIDSFQFIQTYLKNNNIFVEGKQSLSNIAKSVYVMPLYPKHNPINDSRTLFNILAHILQTTGKYLI